MAGEREIGLWDLELVLGDLPALIEKAHRLPLVNLHAVVAPVPAGTVAAGSVFADGAPRLLVSELMPHATRVAEHLALDELVAFTPWQLAGEGTGSYREGRVQIVSLQASLAKRACKPRGGQEIIETAFKLVPLLASILEKRETLPG